MACILIAHDDPQLLRDVRTTLAAAGHTVATTAAADAAARLLTTEAFDCILVKPSLPDADRSDLRAKLQASVRRGVTRVGVIGASPGAERGRGTAEIAGADLVVTPPLDTATILDAVARLLDVHAAAVVGRARPVRRLALTAAPLFG